MQFEQKVKNYIKSQNLIDKKIILAFSYGIDSRALLEVLYNLGYEIILCHVNHKVRKESDLEEEETKKLAKELGIKLYVKELGKIDSDFENKARIERYNFFKEVSKKENVSTIVTAHHLDDNLETILMNLIKGSNLYGYSGIHNASYDNLNFIRPFMCVTKSEIIEYQKEKGFKYFDDQTNFENDHLRNRLRNIVIPELKKENPNLLENVNAYSSITYSSFKHIRKLSIEFLNSKTEIDTTKYKLLDEALRLDIISYLLEKSNISRSYNLISTIDKNLLMDKPQFDINLSNDYLFVKRYQKAYIKQNDNNNYQEYDLYEDRPVIFNGFKIFFTKKPLSLYQNHIKLCYNNLVFPLKVRCRKDGDKILMSYGHKKLKDLFIDKKIEKEKRDTLPIILNNGEIIWAVGVAKSNLISKDKNDGDICLIAEEFKNEQEN